MPSASTSPIRSMASCPLVPKARSGVQPHHRAPGRVLQLLAGDPLPRRDQRVLGALARIRQVHRGDPVGHLARRSPGSVASPRQCARLARPGWSRRSPRPPGRSARRYGRPGPVRNREPAPPPSSGGVPDRPAEHPLHPVRRPVPSPLGHRPSVTPRDHSSARPRTYPPAARAPPARNTDAAVPAAQRVSAGPARRLSRRQQPPSILLSSQTHDRQAAALREGLHHAHQQVKGRMAAAVLVGSVAQQPHM